MTEPEAFLAQASSDLAVFEHLLALERSVIPECHPLHYFQMATEKVAKAIFFKCAFPVPKKRSHVAFSRIPHYIRRRPFARSLGYRSFQEYRRFLDRATPLFRRIEELHPAVGPRQPGGRTAEGPNVEYPWPGRDRAGEPTWHAPANYHFGIADQLLRRGDFAHLRLFVQHLITRFDAMFP